MSIDKQKLMALAEAATQGEWSHERFGVIQAGPVIQFANGSGRQQIAMATGADWMAQGEQIANAEFMAAANPSVVLALLAEIEMLTAQRLMHFRLNMSLRARRKVWVAACEKAEDELLDTLAERNQLKFENEALRDGQAIKRLSGHEVREAFNGAYYQARDIGSDGEQCRAGVLAVIEAAMAKEASRDC